MKKLLLILLLITFSFSVVNAENDKDKREVYCEVVYFVNALSKKSLTIEINGDKVEIIKEGVVVKIKSVSHALNLLAERGWKLRTTFGVTGNNGLLPAEYHYIMAKEIVDSNQIKEGLKEK